MDWANDKTIELIQAIKNMSCAIYGTLDMLTRRIRHMTQFKNCVNNLFVIDLLLRVEYLDFGARSCIPPLVGNGGALISDFVGKQT